jgi:hypothetical protein
MGEYTDLIQTLSLTLGVAWASGINLYAAVAVLGFGGATGYVDLPPGLETVQDPLVILAAAFMYCVEFMADKTPGVDSAWDTVHTFIRIPAGAMLAAGAVGSVDPAIAVAAGLLGGGVTAATHATKAGSRVLINTSPEPFSNWAASLAEDVAVFAGLWAALQHPVLFLAAFVVFLILLCFLLPKIVRGVVAVFRKLGSWLGLTRTAPDPDSRPGPTPSRTALEAPTG